MSRTKMCNKHLFRLAVAGRCDGEAWTHDRYMLAAYEALGKLSPSFRPSRTARAFR